MPRVQKHRSRTLNGFAGPVQLRRGANWIHTRRLHEYLPKLTNVIEASDLVISHCGAGSAFETLCYHVPLIVVPNPILMDNHQVELATLLEDSGHLVHSPPKDEYEQLAS